MSDIDLNSQEVKDAIKAAVTEATAGLVAKRDELLDEVKKLKLGRTIKPEDVEKLESEISDLRDKLTESEKVSKKAAENEAKAHKRAEDAEADARRLLVDVGLSDALVKANVSNPVHQKAAKAMLAGQVQIVDDNGQKVAKVGEKNLADFITEWSGSDEGKHFVTAQEASGGGAQGNRNNGGGAAKKTVSRSDFNAMDHVQRADFVREGGSVKDD